jgi:hypothetical protein
MYARVAMWEGGEADALRASAKDVRDNADQGPPEGVPAVGFTMLIDPDSGKSMGVVLFESEEDLRKGDEALNAMDPPMGDKVGHRVSVQTYEVGADVRM